MLGMLNALSELRLPRRHENRARIGLRSFGNSGNLDRLRYLLCP